MKTKYPTMFGLLVALLLVASFVIPADVKPVDASADATLLWAMLDTPNALRGVTKEVFNGANGPYVPAGMPVANGGAEIVKFAPTSSPYIGYVVMTGLTTATAVLPVPIIWKTTDGAVTWSPAIFGNLTRDVGGAAVIANYIPVYDVAVAPDDPQMVAVVLDDRAAGTQGPTELWVSFDGGASWSDTNIRTPLAAASATLRIFCMDMSADYGGKRDIAVGTRDLAGVTGTGKVWVVRSTGFAGWNTQDATGVPPSTNWPNVPVPEVFQVKFSPNYVGDSTLTVVYANQAAVAPAASAGTFFITGVRDLDRNSTVWSLAPIEILDPLQAPGNSPGGATLVSADLELPSDFSGQAASLRRAYVSLDAWQGKGAANRTGIFRIDDNVVYVLMDTTTTNGKDIASIAYFGTYASGKLLAGERFGTPCTATVPTWFTDSPTTCPIPCWYPAMKPTTGAAGVPCITGSTVLTGLTAAGRGFGNAQVFWVLNAQLAVAVTGSWIAANGALGPAATWFAGLTYTVPLDESAFAISRNNGETWNQLSVIDTKLDKLTDVSPSPDCTTLYLASSNNGTVPLAPGASDNCNYFDSVWRTTTNAVVSSPIPAQPLGTIWERVFCHVTAMTCNMTESQYAILRQVPGCEENTDGQLIFWAAGGTNIAVGGASAQMPALSGFVVGPNTRVMFWSPDFGDYWAAINPRLEVQDFELESATMLYVLSVGGLVQRMPYAGAAWSSTVANGDTLLTVAHTLDVKAEGKVLVGAESTAAGATFPVSFSGDAAATFSPTAIYVPANQPGRKHALFDPKYADNKIFYTGDDTAAAPPFPPTTGGSIWRSTVPPFSAFDDMLGTPFAAYHRNGYFGLVAAYTGDALYGAHTSANTAAFGGGLWCAVERTLYRYYGIPKPHIFWDHLEVGTDGWGFTVFPQFTLEPESLKSCGCCTMDSDTILYAIDNANYSCPRFNGQATNRQDRTTGMLWRYIDCLAKKGPKLTLEDKALIGCDPVSGRNQEINFTWEQLCLAMAYDIEIGKDANFVIKVLDIIGPFTQATLANTFVPEIPMAPAAYFPAGATIPITAERTSTLATAMNLECGHTYYWHVQVRGDAWGGFVRSPWSDTRSFTIKAGLPVTTPYFGPQLLAPNNGCLGCPVKPASFSWSPFKETTEYAFVLSKDANFTQIVKDVKVSNTSAYEFDGTLDYSTNYFWRVMATQPAPSEWSATFSFQTEPKPAPGPEEAGPPPTPLWVWVVIAIGAILVIVTLVLIFKTRRV